MKAAVQKIFEENLTKEQSEYVIRTLKEISRNSSFEERSECHEFPTKSLITAIDFDHIKTIYVNTLGNINGKQISLRSCDALYPTDTDEWYFIEFKDGETNTRVIREVYEKINDSKDILMDLGLLENGYLKVDDLKSVLLPIQLGQIDFQFETRMKNMNYENQIDFLRNHFYFILVYNDKLYEETEMDQEGFRNALKLGEYQKQIEFLENNAYLLRGRSGEEFLKQAIDGMHFKHLIKMIEKASDKGSAENKKLIKRFDTYPFERIELLRNCKTAKKMIGNEEEIKKMSADKFLKAVYIFSIYNRNLLKELKILSKICDLEQHKYDLFIEKLKNSGDLSAEDGVDVDSYVRGLIYKDEFECVYNTLMNNSDVYLRKFIGAMAMNSKIPERLFYLYQYEGKYFKEVYTYSEEEFEKFFVKRFEKEEMSV